MLLAEDDRDLRELLTSVLEHDGASVVAVGDGDEALAALRESAGSLDLAVLDVRMPRITGLEVLRCARREGVVLPIVLLTSFADADLVERATELGASRVVDKPLDADELRALVRSVLRSSGASGEGEPQ